MNWREQFEKEKCKICKDNKANSHKQCVFCSNYEDYLKSKLDKVMKVIDEERNNYSNKDIPMDYMSNIKSTLNKFEQAIMEES